MMEAEKVIQTILDNRDQLDAATVVAVERVADLIQHVGARPSDLRKARHDGKERVDSLKASLVEAQDELALLDSAAQIVQATTRST